MIPVIAAQLEAQPMLPVPTLLLRVRLSGETGEAVHDRLTAGMRGTTCSWTTSDGGDDYDGSGVGDDDGYCCCYYCCYCCYYSYCCDDYDETYCYYSLFCHSTSPSWERRLCPSPSNPRHLHPQAHSLTARRHWWGLHWVHCLENHRTREKNKEIIIKHDLQHNSLLFHMHECNSLEEQHHRPSHDCVHAKFFYVQLLHACTCFSFLPHVVSILKRALQHYGWCWFQLPSYII